MYTEIGSFNAKTQLSALLQEVKRGKRFRITVRGQAIADLVPPSDSDDRQDILKAIEEMQKIKRIKGVSSEIISQWIVEGRPCILTVLC